MSKLPDDNHLKQLLFIFFGTGTINDHFQALGTEQVSTDTWNRWLKITLSSSLPFQLFYQHPLPSLYWPFKGPTNFFWCYNYILPYIQLLTNQIPLSFKVWCLKSTKNVFNLFAKTKLSPWLPTNYLLFSCPIIVDTLCHAYLRLLSLIFLSNFCL